MTVATWRYELSVNGEWARFLLDSAGMLAVCSSCGNYAFTWGAFGEDFRAFVLGRGTDYISNKFEHQFHGKPNGRAKQEMGAFFRRIWPKFQELLRADIHAPASVGGAGG